AECLIIEAWDCRGASGVERAWTMQGIASWAGVYKRQDKFPITLVQSIRMHGDSPGRRKRRHVPTRTWAAGQHAPFQSLGFRRGSRIQRARLVRELASQFWLWPRSQSVPNRHAKYRSDRLDNDL